MPRQELVKELQLREKQLLEELKAIRVILGTDETDIPTSSGRMERGAPSGTPKGKMSWENYVELILGEIGGRGKSQDVAQAIYKADPKIDKDRALHAVRHHLSKLLKYDKIGADKGGTQSEGYTFFIKK